MPGTPFIGAGDTTVNSSWSLSFKIQKLYTLIYIHLKEIHVHLTFTQELGALTSPTGAPPHSVENPAYYYLCLKKQRI